MKNLNQELGERIKDIRKEKGLSQMELAKLIGSKQGNISLLEKGALNSSIEYLSKVATALNKEIKITFINPKVK